MPHQGKDSAADPSAPEYQEQLRKDRDTVLNKNKSIIDNIKPPTRSPAASNGSHTVMLTGSSGALGSFVLDVLLKTPSVNHVYCLNRSKDPVTQQIERNTSRNLPTTFDRSRVSFLTCDLTEPNFSLPQPTYNTLLADATLIIHNAWPINFNAPLPPFTKSISTIPSLLTFSSASHHRAHIHFISSLGAAFYHPSSPSGQIPARIIPSRHAPMQNGYSVSKHVSELLLAHGAARLPQLSGSLSLSRVGQVAGAAHRPGLWKLGEWLPRCVISSRYVGALPDHLGGMNRIAWVPVDELARVVVELALGAAEEGRTGGGGGGGVMVFHPHNPTARRWGDVSGLVKGVIEEESGKEIVMVSLREWIDRVRQAVRDGSQEQAKENPAGLLLGFYEVLLTGEGEQEAGVFDVDSALERSDTLRSMKGVGVKDEWIKKWVLEWLRATAPARQINSKI